MSEKKLEKAVQPVDLSEESNGVSHKEFTQLVNSVAILADQVQDVTKALKESKSKQQSTQVEDESIKQPEILDPSLKGAAESYALPPSYRQAVDEILGKDFGAVLSFDDSENPLFSVVVPLAKSNATKEHIEVHKSDIRTISLSGGKGLPGVREWCKRIRKNLEKSNIRFPQTYA